MATVFFAGDDNFEATCNDGDRLQDVIDKAGADIMFGCREGSCATCMIQVTDGMGNLNAPTEAEQTTLLPEELEQGVRLACQCRVQSGKVTVERADGIL